jgi:16S rRNA (guanine527-N7)-methyltransferase
VSEQPLAGLSPAAREALATLLEMLAEPAAPSAVQGERAWQVHVADSLVGLAVPELSQAKRIADLGAGAGFPGLVLAIALPAAEVDLIESVARKCEFMQRAIEAARIDNARVLGLRSEEWAKGTGRERYEVVTARAVGRLATLAELASPLLREAGIHVAWKGRRDEEEEAQLRRAAQALAMKPLRILPVKPFAASRHRHLHVMAKAGPTPGWLPRRAGLAKKRPQG